MKKIFMGILLAGLCLMLSACGASKVDLALNNLAEVRYNVFSGENDNFTANFMSGKRENPYAVNGVCQKQVEFGMLTIKYKTDDAPIVAQYKLKIGENEYSGSLEYNPYDKTLMVDIGKVVEDNAEIMVTVTTTKGDESCTLNAKTTDLEITWRTALEIAIKNLDKDFEKYISKGKLNGEVYVKIITDLNGAFDTYYWYVSIVGTNGSTNGVIIDPNSGEVIAKN